MNNIDIATKLKNWHRKQVRHGYASGGHDDPFLTSKRINRLAKKHNVSKEDIVNEFKKLAESEYRYADLIFP